MQSDLDIFLFVDIYYSIHLFCKQATKTLISLNQCANRSGPALSENCIRAFFVHSNEKMGSVAVLIGILTFSTLWANTSDNSLAIFFLFFLESRFDIFANCLL